MGENRAREAATAAVNSPLLDVSIHGAKGVLFAIYGAEDLGMFEVQEAAKIITESVDKDAKIIFGIATDPTLKKDEIKVTVIATGFPSGFVNQRHAPLEHVGTNMHEEIAKREESLRPEPRVEKTESIRETIIEATEEKRIDRIDLEMKEGETKLVEDTKKSGTTAQVAGKKPVFKFEDEDDEDEWEALPPFLRRKK
jgi:cell division protein FtsZ